MALSSMGKMHISINDDVETQFRDSIPGLKKGDISKKIEELMLKSLNQEIKESKKEKKIIDSVMKDLDKLSLVFYNCEEFSMIAANKFALELDKIKRKNKINS
jgi:hypothetical protein